MDERTVDGFFYGLFMDQDVLAERGIEQRNPRCSFVDGYQLLIGNRATLWPASGARAYGMIYAMTHTELEKLYSGQGLTLYKAEALTAVTLEGSVNTACLCYNLTAKPAIEERNIQYAENLKQALLRLGFPTSYIDSLE